MEAVIIAEISKLGEEGVRSTFLSLNFSNRINRINQLHNLLLLDKSLLS